jgi:acetyl esterase/lipase
MKQSTWLILLLFACTATAQTRRPTALANVEVPPARRISYGTDPLQFGELRVPSTQGPHPVAIVVHGGCWSAKLGSYEERVIGVDHMRPFAAALTDAGIATWNVEYRRLGNDGGGWPGTFHDVAHAADFIKTLADKNRLDLTRIIAIGHSAGGHLAMWLAARPKLPKTSDLYMSNPLSLSGVVNLDGPCDLKELFSRQEQVCGSPVITNLMGGSADEQPERYRAASPIELLPLGVRQEVFAGNLFAEEVPEYEKAAKNAGDVVRTTVLAEPNHFVFIDPQSEVFPKELGAVRLLLAKPEAPRMTDGTSRHSGGRYRRRIAFWRRH